MLQTFLTGRALALSSMAQWEMLSCATESSAACGISPLLISTIPQPGLAQEKLALSFVPGRELQPILLSYPRISARPGMRLCLD